MRCIVQHLTGTSYGYTYREGVYSAMYICDICYDKHIRQRVEKDVVFEVEAGDHHICFLCHISHNEEMVDNYFKKNYPKVEGRKGMVKRWYPVK